jgi:hypothetical protein
LESGRSPGIKYSACFFLSFSSFAVFFYISKGDAHENYGGLLQMLSIYQYYSELGTSHRSLLLSKPWFYEQWRSIRKKSEERRVN